MRRIGDRRPFRGGFQSKARAVRINGIYHRSQGEAHRWAELRILEQQGIISRLRRQVRLALHAVNQKSGEMVKVGVYVADFTYFELPEGRLCVEDVKGLRTELYSWKKRHLKIEYDLDIQEV